MAAKHFYRQGFLLLLFNFISTAALEKRFSDLKRCADEECSMLLCRGKAVKDFTGPDCRFLSFKQSETIYVYYKLSGKRTDLWAGSVGNNFGYFPKDLLAINHIYTEKEHEIPAEETDFVCFDTGFDKFDNYDVDFLLSSLEGNDAENKDKSDQNQVGENAQKEAKPSTNNETDSEKETEPLDSAENLDKIPADQSASPPELEPDSEAELPFPEEVESETAPVPDSTERTAEDREAETAHVESVVSETKDAPAKPEGEPEKEPVSISEEAQIPELQTTLGTTFDAVTTDEEVTKNVTPYDEEESEYEEHLPEDDVDVVGGTPLLSFSEETVNTPTGDSFEKPDSDEDNSETTKEKDLWSSLGDAVFKVVTGGEVTPHDFSSEEEDDDEEIPSTFEEDLKEPESEIPKHQENTEPALPDVPSTSAQAHQKETHSDKHLFDHDVTESDGDVVGSNEAFQETLKPADEPVHHQREPRMTQEDSVLPEDASAVPVPQKSLLHRLKPAEKKPEPLKHKEEEEKMFRDTEVDRDNADAQHQGEDLDHDLTENKTVVDQELDSTDTGTQQDPSTEEIQLDVPDVKDDENSVTVDDSSPSQIPDQFMPDLETETQPEPSVEDPETHEKPFTEEPLDDKEAETEEPKEELLEDENALSVSQSNLTDPDEPSPDTAQPTASTPEPEYSESVLRLTLIRDHFEEEKMERIQQLLGLKNLFRIEAMFQDLDTELQGIRSSHRETTEDIENALEGVLEASENTILDEIERMMDTLGAKHYEDHHKELSSLDEETEILDDFQELAFSLRQKYSTASDSTPLATQNESDIEKGDHESTVEHDTPHVVEEDVIDPIPEAERDDNLTASDPEERPVESKPDPIVLAEVPGRPDVSVEEDGGHFNKNKDNQPSFSPSDEMHKVPQAILDSPLDVGLGVEVEHSPSGSLDSVDPVSDLHDEEEDEEQEGFLSTGLVYMGCIITITKTKFTEWTIEIISLLPEEWKPGETLFGCPWQAVVVTAVVGVMTFTLFFWRTVLAVKKREYLVDEKKLTQQVQALKKEKSEALTRISELQEQTEKLKEKQKQSKESVDCSKKRVQDLESKVLKAQTQHDNMAEEKRKYAQLLDEEKANSLKNETRIEKLEKSNEKLQQSRKKIQEALSKTTVLLDEAKIREDARGVQHKCLEKDYTALKEENKTLKATIRGWEDKHKELNEQIKVYQKSQKELEDSVVLKDHNVEVLSDLLADLDACDLQKSDAKVVANGDVAPDKKTAIKNRIRQMMDVSRAQTTLAVVEEERDRFMAKLLNEEKSRKSLEEQHQELEHAIATLKSDKSHVENQFKILQQKNEIMVEMYQQKENALQQRLTKEELERRSKESMLSEVGGKAVEAEEQVKVLRQRINEMEDQMKKTEEVYKEQIKEQENKTHSNWVTARNAERALNQEKLESSKLREKLAVLTSQLNERRAPLFRPNSGQPSGPRQGDSYGPSPVSGGAPSPPPMIEGPRRPPSAPVGRRIDPYGPRPPSEPHGRYVENKHISGMDMMGPRSSSPANMDGSGPGSFLASPIRDSPVQGPPPGPGPHDHLPPPGPLGRLPPPGPYRPPRAGPYHLPPGPPIPPPHGPPLPANGHPGMPLPGPMGGEFGPRPTNGHAFHPRLGPGHVIDPRGPPPPHFRPPPPHHFGPMPPPHGIRGPMGPRPPIPPDMRFPGPRDHSIPPMNLPPGVPPHPAHGQASSNALRSPEGAHTGPEQNPHVGQEAPQDSVRPAMVKP
ncbi:uncharacterized protein V6R79_018310 [Siganus canaliculatus]